MTLTTIKYIFQLNALKIALQQLQQNAERAVSIKSASCIAKSASSRTGPLALSPNSQPGGTGDNVLSGLHPSTCSRVGPGYKTSVDIALVGHANAQNGSPRKVGDHIEEGLCR